MRRESGHFAKYQANVRSFLKVVDVSIISICLIARGVRFYLCVSLQVVGVITRAICFPFDLFGNPGAKAGAELLGDAIKELLADNRRETVPTRARAYSNKVRVGEHGFTTLDDYRDWRAAGRTLIRKSLDAGEFLFWIAGNHLGALPLYDELAGTRDDMIIVQLDAHLDIYNLSDCTTDLSHGNFLLHAANPIPRVVNVGHRELLLRPDHIAKYYDATISAVEFNRDESAALTRLSDLCSSAERVFLDLDCDFFDPAYFPATAQGRPFGLAPLAIPKLLAAIGMQRLAGFAISEFDPAREAGDRCLETLMWLIEWVLLAKYEKTVSHSPLASAGLADCTD